MRPVIQNIAEGLRPAVMDKLVGVLKSDGIAVVGVDTVYGLVGKAFNRMVFDRLDAIKGDRNQPYAVVFESSEALINWHGKVNLIQMRLIRQLLPGPVSLVLPSAHNLNGRYRYYDGTIAVRVTADPLMRKLCNAVGSPLWATSANRSGDPAPVQFSNISPSVLKAVDIAIDSGPTLFRQSSTVINISQYPYNISRKGAWLDRAQRMVAALERPLDILILCTGNICRSPFAEAVLSRELIAQGVADFIVHSAGTHTEDGLAASAGMQAVAVAEGLDLSAHKSRQLTVDMLEGADLVLTATTGHYEFASQLAPKAGDKVHRLGEPIGVELVPDPYDSDIALYRQTGEIIKNACSVWARWIAENLPENSPWRLSSPQVVPKRD